MRGEGGSRGGAKEEGQRFKSRDKPVKRMERMEGFLPLCQPD